MTTGFVQIAPDSTGKQLDNDVVTIPAGTVLTDGSGNQTTLAAPAYYFRERIVNADPNDPRGVATVTNTLSGSPGPTDYGLTVRIPVGQPEHQAMLALLSDIDAVLNQMIGQGPMGSTLPIQGINAIRQHTLPPPVMSQSVPMPVMADRFGRLITLPIATRATTNANSVTISSTTETNIYPADAFNFSDMMAIVVTNTSATAVRVDIRDQPSTVTNPPSSLGVMPIYVPAGDMRGVSFSIPNYQSNLNQPWTATLSSAVTDIRVWVYMAQTRAA